MCACCGLPLRPRIVPRSARRWAVRAAAKTDTARSGELFSGEAFTELVEVDGRRRRRFMLHSPGRLTAETDVLSREDQAGSATDALKGFFLPAGYPDSVARDYLPYQLWAVPCHVTGWMASSLATSSLLQAVGIGSGAAAAASATAAIKWITKDAVGVAGRLLVGGRLGGVFDEDPKRWRLTAEIFKTLGLAAEIATPFFPGSFVALAGAGNFSRAVGKGLGNPCFRIIQTHQAIAGNVGDIAAKEEVWEVAAQLAGLGASVALLRAIEATGRPENVVAVWTAVQAAHVALRYQSLAVLRFDSLNQQRACACVRAHVAGCAVPGVDEANAAEVLWALPAMARPSVSLGASVERALGLTPDRKHLQALLAAHAGEKHVLVWRGGRGMVLLHEGVRTADLLRPLWQAAWLDHAGVRDASAADTAASLAALRERFDDFQRQLRAAGDFRHITDVVLS
ncbi:hypothetical protein WJX81_000773 [Elliptochloris bilobata]|uniref:Root UVB sensitive family n=1 Tax=Elliptochloris bilobata TaxID=381761 RepID=A0AAW1RNS2_9CHLO